MKSYDELLAERNALAAQLRMVKNIFRDDSLSPSETLRKIPFVIDLDPQQRLAEIKAEAGRAGFIEGADNYFDRHYDKNVSDSVLKAAEEYAYKIRNGEIK